MTAPTITDHAALAAALNDYARVADQEAAHARTLRDEEIRRLHADGENMTELADRLGVRRSYLYRILKDT